MSERAPRPTPKVSLLWTVLFAVVATAGGSFLGRYIERSRPVSAEAKLNYAQQQFQSGYDQAALASLKPLADQGNPKAQYWLADLYENGLGVKADIATAIALLNKSAAQGFVPAERRLGDLYLQGDKTFQDFGKAQNWLHKAAVEGSNQAQQQMGQIYAMGLGVAADRPKAYGWYENAALHGNGIAQHMRDDLVTKMSPADIQKGEEDAKSIGAEIKTAQPPIGPIKP